MTERNLEIQLNADRLAFIINSAVVNSIEIVNFHFNALSVADLSKPVQTTETMYKFKTPELSVAQRRALHENWILAKAFQELLRAVRHALEEAHVFASLLSKGKHTVRSSGTLDDFLRPFRKAAADLVFPDLLTAVNELLHENLVFSDAYRSLQSARNCLEHRDGIVSQTETRGADAFELSIPRIKLFYMRNGTEVELEIGHIVEPENDEASAEILMKIDLRRRALAPGERIVFTLTEFNEIAFACHFLGAQLSSKLPKPRVAQT